MYTNNLFQDPASKERGSLPPPSNLWLQVGYLLKERGEFRYKNTKRLIANWTLDVSGSTAGDVQTQGFASVSGNMSIASREHRRL